MLPQSYTKWLSNFTSGDQPWATKLFDAVQFLSLADLEHALNELIVNMETTKLWGIYPLMDKANFKVEENYLDLIKSRKIMTEEDGNVINNADSEYVIMHLIRNYAKSNSHIINMPVKEDIKIFKIRNFIIVTDILASGDQIKHFLDYFTKDATVKSYKSLGIIDSVTVLAHLVTEQSLLTFEELKRHYKSLNLQLKYYTKARTIDTFFTNKEEKNEIKNLCQKYSIRKNYSLGYNNTGLLSIYQQRVPNNTPAIFMQSGRNWNTLLKKRRVAAQIRKLKELNTGESTKTLIEVLTIISESKKNNARRLSEKLNISISNANGLITNLSKANYLTLRGNISDLGRRLLKKNKRSESLKPQDEFVIKKYYPYFKGVVRI
ncbi:hypothetical protein HGB47_20750 [Leptospira yasudae]|uniref:phosphoribosyltransferase-like protein n=1 Tax=Leptospira yasudae TaxID=2202201 RepID=UPI001C4FBA59|nr:hypothetical protein [Leptospira yasudae]MBW0436040.1 hypothetical protein [Leptospira yasudae]